MWLQAALRELELAERLLENGLVDTRGVLGRRRDPLGKRLRGELEVVEEHQVLLCLSWASCCKRKTTSGMVRPGRRLVRHRLALVPLPLAQILAIEGVEKDGFQGAERIIADLDPVAAVPRIDLEEEPLQLHVGEVRMHFASLATEEVLEHLLEIDVPGEAAPLVISLQGRLTRFAMGLLVVALLEPGGQGVVEPIEREDLAGADLAFQLALGSLEEAFDQPAGRRISHAAVRSSYMMGIPSCFTVLR